MEIWIAVAIAVAVLVVYVAGRLRRLGRRAAPGDPKNIYPLW
jgi:hypothetical protein